MKVYFIKEKGVSFRQSFVAEDEGMRYTTPPSLRIFLNKADALWHKNHLEIDCGFEELSVYSADIKL